MVAQSDPQSILQRWLFTPPSFTTLQITDITPTDRTLTTTTATPSTTTLASIPLSNVITTTTALTDPLVTEILAAHPPPSPTTPESAGLLLFLLLRNDEFKPWFDMLPSVIHTATTVDSVDRLIGTPLYHLVKVLKQELESLFDTWFIPITASYPTHFPPAQITKQSFLHAHGILESRAFQLSDTTTLTPYLDFCNHSPTPNAKIVPSDTAIDLIATTPIPAGTAVTISYGQLSNMDLLLHWGFAIPGNPCDSILVSLDEPDVARTLILTVCVAKEEFLLSMADPLPCALVMTARILALTDSELVDAVKRDYAAVISARNESAAVQVLREIVRGLRCGRAENLPNGEGQQEFDKFCVVYKDGIEDILDAAENKIHDLENSIP